MSLIVLSPFLFGLDVINYFFYFISNPSLFRNRLFRSPSSSRKISSNSLYKGFIVISNVDREIDIKKKFQQLILSFEV